MVLKVKGIIISETNYKESSKILNVLTNDYGLIGIISRGCKSMKSNLRSVSQKLIYGEFTINYKEKSLSTLIEVNVLNSFKNIYKDLKKISYVFYILDLINQVLKENNDKEIFNILEDSLIKIDDGLNPLLITNIIELKLLKYIGVPLILDKCVICENNDNIKTISIKEGGLICKDCYNDEYILNIKTIKLIRLMYYVDINKLDSINIEDNNIIREINDFIKEYYNIYTGIYLKNKENINKL